MRIDLRHDERNVWLHAKCARVVDDYRPGGRGQGAPLPGDAARSAREHDIDVLKCAFGDRLDSMKFAAEGHRVAGASLGRKKLDGSDRKGPFFEKADHPVSHGSAGPHHGNVLHARAPYLNNLVNHVTEEYRIPTHSSMPRFVASAVATKRNIIIIIRWHGVGDHEVRSRQGMRNCLLFGWARDFYNKRVSVVLSSPGVFR